MLQQGQRLDVYRIMSYFQSGGMGEIYLAEELPIGRQVAIKVMRPEAIQYPNSEEARKASQLFRREAEAIAKLNHPYILPLYRFGEETIGGTSLMYMVMPYCEEKSLADWMYHQGRTNLNPQEVAHIVQQAAEALQYAHDRGIVHLDVKPSNFLVRDHADTADKLNLQLADFGIAKFTGTSSMSQTVRGSLDYMAPEQWEGNPVFASDQYALATTAYKLLVSRTPFQGDSFQQMWHQHRFVTPPPVSAINSSIPKAVDAVLLRALAKDPRARYPGILAFAQAFQQAVSTNNNFTAYGPIQQAVTLTPQEAYMGTNRTIMLPGGHQLPIYLPAGVQEGQVIRQERQNAPPVLVTVHIGQLAQLWQPAGQPTPPVRQQRGPLRLTTLVIIAVAVLVILSGIIGAVAYTTVQGNNANATATSRNSTAVALNATNTAVARNLTATHTFPDVAGAYAGQYQYTSSSTGTMDLTLQQNQGTLTGTCQLETFIYTIQDGSIDTDGNLQFKIVGTVASTQFNGKQQADGSLKGTFVTSTGGGGSWTVSKT